MVESPSISLQKVKLTPNLRSIQNQYEGFLFDIWGVVHDGYTAFPGVVDLLNQLISEQKKIIFLSNAPRPGIVLIKKLKDLGIAVVPEMIYSSGDEFRKQYIQLNNSLFQDLGKRFFHLGAERNTDILSNLNADVTERLEDASFVLLTAYMDEDEDLNQHDAFLKRALKFNLPLVCVNPDKDIDNGEKLRFCAGVLAEKYEKMGGKCHYYGKPFPAIFESAIEMMKESGIVDRKKILMIGDTLETDILGARNARIDSALILAGNTARLINQATEKYKAELNYKNNASFNREQYLQRLFEERNLYPTYVLESLA